MKKILLLTVIAITVSFLTVPLFTSATGAEADTLQETTFDVGTYLNMDGQDQSYFDKDKHEHEVPIVSFMLTVINFALRVIGSIAMIILIIGGFMLMAAQGNQQKLDEAKDIFKYALIGLIITFLSYIIVIFVQSLFISGNQ